MEDYPTLLQLRGDCISSVCARRMYMQDLRHNWSIMSEVCNTSRHTVQRRTTFRQPGRGVAKPCVQLLGSFVIVFRHGKNKMMREWDRRSR